MSLESTIRDHARSLGFDACRFTTADAAPELAERLRAWLDMGAHGDMGWMAETADRRVAPTALWPEARSVVMLGLNYGPAADPLDATARKDCGAISVYARHRDYHDIVKGRLKQLAAFIVKRAGRRCKSLCRHRARHGETPGAERAGLGWQGKHTNLVSREFGSWLFLGASSRQRRWRRTPPKLTIAAPAETASTSARRRPSSALIRLDARRCVSYLTIECKGPIPREFRAAIGNRIYGCDDCLAVCPWNKFAQVSREAKLAARPDLESPKLAQLARLDDAAFRALFAGSPIKRIGRARFLRNVLIAIGNSGDPALAAEAERLLRDPDSLVRGAAVWALARVAPKRLVALQDESVAEVDESVREEWAKETHSLKI